MGAGGMVKGNESVAVEEKGKSEQRREKERKEKNVNE